MTIQFTGIIIVLLMVLIPVLSFRLFQQQKVNASLFSILILGVALRFFVASDPGLHDWDERYHALVAKNMIEEPFKPTLYKNPVLPYDYKNWTENHVWLHKQPMTLWLMAGSIGVFGVNEFAVRFPSILITTLGILMVFSLGKILWNEKIGLIAAFLYAIHGLMLEQIGGRTTTDHIDITFLFFIQLGVYLAVLFFERGKFWLNILCGLAVGLALLTKWLPALIVLPIWLVYGWRNFQGSKWLLVGHFVMLLSCLSIVALPWQLYIHHYFPLEARWESEYNFRHLFDPIEGHGKSWYYYINLIRELFGELIYLPLIWLIWNWFKNVYNPKVLMLLVWIFVPLLVFSLAATKMQGYILFSAPAFFLVIALFVDYVHRNIETSTYSKWMYVPVFLLIALPIRYSIERTKPFSSREQNFTWMLEIRKLNALPNQEKTIIFNSERYVELMFYTNMIAYSYELTPDDYKRLTQNGYIVYASMQDALLELESN